MSDHDSDSAISDAVISPLELAAAEWVVRHSQGLTTAEKAEFARWMGQDHRHAAVYAEMVETSDLLDSQREAAAARTMAFPGVPGANGAKRRSVSSPGRSKITQQVVRALAAAAAIAAIAAFSWRHLAPGSLTYAAEFGATRQVNLPDGSVVRLNSESAVEVNYDGHSRHVRLTRGEAYFSVAKDSQRPFWVDTGALSVRAVGTQFNVRIRSDEVSVLVSEGKVRIVPDRDRASAPGAALDQMGLPVGAGQLAELATAPAGSAQAPAVVLTAVDARGMKSALAWQQGRLEFFETPLSEVVAQFNRYNRHQIVIADPALASRRFGGAFDAHQVEPLLELLQQSFGVVTVERGGVTEIRSSR